MTICRTGKSNYLLSCEFKLAQADVYYYGYCFETPDALECYWYPAADVIVTADTQGKGQIRIQHRRDRRQGALLQAM